MNLTKEEAIKEYREQWKWQAENPMLPKSRYPKFEKQPVLKECYLCEFTGFTCSKCPVEWPKTHDAPWGGNGIPCMASYFNDWERATAPEERSRLAALIRDLPEKKDEKPALKVGDWVKVRQWEDMAKEFKTDSESCYDITPAMLELTTPPAPKFAVGDRVVPISKSIGIDRDHQIDAGWIRSRERGYFFVNRLFIKEEKNACQCGYRLNGGGDYFLESDLTPYVEPKKEVKVESKFQVGDRVRVTENDCADVVKLKGKIGIICDTTEIGRIGIEFFENIYGHDCFKKCKSGHGWNVEIERVEPFPRNFAPENKTLVESKTFIFKDNKTTCIIDVDGQKWTGCAWCEPNDVWDENEGKKWAEGRAVEKMKASKVVKVQELKRIKVATEHLALIVKYGQLVEKCCFLGQEEAYDLLKQWSDKVRKALGATQAIKFQESTMEFILFDIPADKVNFNKGSISRTNPDGTYYLEV